MENIYCVIRPQDNVIVSIMFNESDNSYHFVNLSQSTEEYPDL